MKKSVVFPVRIIVLLVVHSLIVLSSLSSFALAADVDPAVQEQLQERGTADVIVMLKAPAAASLQLQKKQIQEMQKAVLQDLDYLDKRSKDKGLKVGPSVLSQPDFVPEKQYTTINAFSGELNAQGLEDLRNDPRVERIAEDKVLQVMLSSSIPLIQVNATRKLWVNGQNLTGKGETVCIIDTGIDTDHSAFSGRIKSQYCACQVTDAGSGGCCSGGTATSSSAEDDHGHGTHVAGIAAGNDSTYRGVAPEAGIVAIKVCNSAGSCAESDIIAGIDWCTNNRSLYNISIISMSLGGGGPYNQYCNNDSVAPAINSAFGQNISVVVAAGNNGFTNGISSPACVQNATPVGAVSDSDGMLYNRGDILSLLAPGQTITAPYIGGGTTSLSGTSMATPHVSGAMLLLQQFSRAQLGRLLSPSELDDKLNSTGKAIVDSSGSGLTFYRLNVWDALVLLDTVFPAISFAGTTPSNASVQNSSTVIINISSSEALQNATLTWNGTNESMTSVIGSSSVTKTGLSEGRYTFKVYAQDYANKSNETQERAVTVNAAPTLSLVKPLDREGFNESFFLNLTTTEGSASNVSSCTYNITNASGTIAQQGANQSIFSSSFTWLALVNVSNSSFSHGNYTLSVECLDNYNARNSSSVAFAVTDDPLLATISAPLDRSNWSESLVTLNASVTSIYPLLAVIFNVSNSSSQTLLTASLTGNFWNATLNTSAFSEGEYKVMLVANDSKGNVNSTVTVNGTVDKTVPSVALLSPANLSEEKSATILNFTYNATDSLLDVANCTLLINGTVNQTNTSIQERIAQNITSGISNGNYTWAVRCRDTAGNTGTSETRQLAVSVQLPSVTLESPAQGISNTSLTMAMRCSASHNLNLVNLTLWGNFSGSWLANETVSSSGLTANTTFSKTLAEGNYRWNCRAVDNTSREGWGSANRTFTVDATKPVVSSVSSGTPAATTATVSWTTNELANASVNYGTNSSTLGTLTGTTSSSTSQSVALSGLTASTTYHYNATSCDAARNCQTNGTFSFTTAAAGSDSSSSSSSSGGGGGGGGGGGATATPTTAVASETSAAEAIAAEEAAAAEAAAVQDQAASGTASTISFSATVTTAKDEPATVSVDLAAAAVKSLIITTTTDKEVSVTVTPYTEKPATFPELARTYQFMDIKVDAGEDLEEALVQFEVPLSWIEEQKVAADTIVLATLEDEEWVQLPTVMVDASVARYEAKVKHFSAFAVTAAPDSGNSLTGFIVKILPKSIGGQGLILISIVVMMAFLLLVYRFVKEEE